jgi:DNA-binding MarR family transcriptional regulator
MGQMSTASKSLALGREREQAWRLYLRAHALLVRRLDQELRAECGISLNAYDALVQLSEAPDRRLKMKDLADALVYSRSGLTRVVDSLERAGLARREPDPADRRAILVVLSEDGLRALKGAWPVHVRGVDQYWARHLTDQQARSVVKVSSSVIEAVDPS